MNNEDTEPREGTEEPDQMTPEQVALSDAIFDQLAVRWRAEDIASGRIKPARPRRRQKKTLVAKNGNERFEKR